jgi:23S rRNA pseudouridine1911/1915/1917 synthase
LAYELANGGQVSIINRLDRETSGLTLVAKRAEAARRLGMLMERRAFTKEYRAIVFGWPGEEAFTVDAPMARAGAFGPSEIFLKQAVHPRGAPALTFFEVERRLERPGAGRFALVRAFPATGRTHQIRVHLAHAGFPLVGDKIYGADERCYLEFIETGWTPALERRLLLDRHALHACGLAVPDAGLRWESPLPPDLVGWLAGCEDSG